MSADTATYKLWVSANRRIMVRLWPDGQLEVATRDHPEGLWGAPVWLEREQRHHVLIAQRIRREAPHLEFDLRGSMLLCSDCHSSHHASGPGARKIPLWKVPEAAIAFTVDVLGEGPAAEYFRRRYRCDQTVAA